MEPLKRTREAYFQAVVDAFDGPIYVCSPDHRIEFVNGRMIEWLGRDAVGEACHDALCGLEGPCPWCPGPSVFEGQTAQREIVNPRDGRWYDLMASPVFHPDGTRSCLTLCLDITEKKSVQKAFLECERQLGTLMNNLPGIVYRCRADDSFTMEFASEGSKRLLGYEPRELLDKGPNAYQRIVHPDDRKNMLALVRKLVAEKRAFSFIYRIRTAAGDEKWVWEQGEGVFDKEDRLVALEGFICDVTAYKEVELDLREENRRLRSSISDRFRFGEIIGKSPQMQDVYDLILKAAASDANVIIFGESGSGKELVARAIHNLSERRKGAFVPVNCGAVPKELMEREFFGHRKGAFTGANSDKRGVLDFADGGTLFLDEIGEIDLNMQVKLLRALDGLGYTPLGDTKVKKSDFRVIAATNRDLVALVKEGRMREDFFYRIRILPIKLPPLRERHGDIPLLIDHFLSEPPGAGEPLAHLPVRIREALESYSWPGNVRELQNVLHTYLTLGKLDLIGTLSMDDAEEEDLTGEIGTGAKDLRERVAAFEKKLILKALENNRWHRGRAADAMGLNYKTLQRKMRAHGIR